MRGFNKFCCGKPLNNHLLVRNWSIQIFPFCNFIQVYTIIRLSEIQRKTGDEIGLHGIMGLNLGTQIDANGENMEDRDRERSVEFKQNSCEIKLDEGDIPGSTLSKPPEQCNKAVLKRWPACRGAKVGGNRDELIKRFVVMMVFGV